MKIKRYFAPDIRQAIRMVREEQGPDAVILSNRKVDGGVEIVAARDFDEQVLLDRTKGEARGRPNDGLDDEPRRFSEPANPASVDAKRRTEGAFREVMNKLSGTDGHDFGDGEFQRRPSPPPMGRAEQRGAPREGGFFADEAARKLPPEPPGRAETRRAAARDDLFADETARRSPAPPAKRAEPRAAQGNFFAEEASLRQPAPKRTEANRGSAGPDPFADEIQRRPAPPSKRTERPEDHAVPPQPRKLQEPARSPERPRPESKAAPTAPGLDDKLIRDMHRELRQMRQVLDTHLTETGWQSAANRSPIRLDLLRRFSSLGFSKRLCLDLAERLEDIEDFDTALESSQNILARELLMADDNLLEYGGIAALVGPTGVGKTTTIAKLAAKFRLKHGPRQIALITTDNYRIAAHEQLTTYGRILDVPVRVASGIEELHHLLNSFYDRRLILIDTAGMGQRDMRLVEQIALFSRLEMPIKSYLVLSAASQLRTMQEAMEAFQGFAPEACVLTKLDETAQVGTAVSAVIESRLPVAFLCDGQQVPEDLHVARSHLLLSRCFAEHTDAEDVDARPFSYEDWVAHANV
jgi:flagellar biosynthesis protein FlhF